MIRNQDIHEAFKNSRVRKWLCAEKLGINDSNFSRKLRKELSRNEKEKIFKIIEEIKNEQEEI